MWKMLSEHAHLLGRSEYVRLSKEVFRYGRNTRFWLLQLREDLFIFLILHHLNQLLQNFKILPFKMRLSEVFRPFLKRSLAYLVSM